MQRRQATQNVFLTILNLWKSHQGGNRSSETHVNDVPRPLKIIVFDKWVKIYKCKKHIMSLYIYKRNIPYAISVIFIFEYLSDWNDFIWSRKAIFTRGKCYWLIISYGDYIWIFIFPWKWINYFNYPGWLRMHLQERKCHEDLSKDNKRGLLPLLSAGFHAQLSRVWGLGHSCNNRQVPSFKIRVWNSN